MSLLIINAKYCPVTCTKVDALGECNPDVVGSVKLPNDQFLVLQIVGGSKFTIMEMTNSADSAAAFAKKHLDQDPIAKYIIVMTGCITIIDLNTGQIFFYLNLRLITISVTIIENYAIYHRESDWRI